MPEFVYQGVGKDGKRVNGRLAAPSEGDLRVVLRGMGVRPTRIEKPSLAQADIGTAIASMLGMEKGQTIGLEQLVVFTRQLNVLISSGIPLVQALDVLIEQAETPGLKLMVTAIREKVSSGNYLWEALGAYPKAFPKLYIALVRAGESAGAMDQVLKRLSRYLEDNYRLQKLIKSAMMYPAIVVVIGVGVVAGLLTFVIPKFEELLKGSGQELPGPTQFVIDASHFMTSNLVYIVGGTITTVFLTRRYVKSDEGRAALDRLLFRAPIFGPILQKGGVARFSRTLTTLLSSGVNLIDAIDICRSTIDNAVLEDDAKTIRAEVEAGKTLGSVVSRLKSFPRMASQMISVGEATGSLDKMLEKVADFYEAEVETLVGGLTKLIEPIILVFLGGTVGGMLIAMYLPIFKLAGSAG